MWNMIGNVRVTSHCGAFALCLYNFGYRNRLIIFHSKRALLWRFHIAGKKNKMYLGLHVKYPIFLPACNQICNSWTCFHESPRYQISRKFVQWKPRWYLRTDRPNGQMYKSLKHFFFSILTKHGFFSKDFHESPQCEISRKYMRRVTALIPADR